MMSGAILASEGKPENLLPSADRRVVPGPRAAAAADRRERGTAPASLQLVPSLLGAPHTIQEAILALTAARGGRSSGSREAQAALVVAAVLGWIAFEP